MVETPFVMPYPGDIVFARIARHRRHTSAKTGNPAIPLSPRPHTLLPLFWALRSWRAWGRWDLSWRGA